MRDTAIVFGAGVPAGIGGAIALRFASEGLHVVVCGRTLEKLQATVTAIEAKGGTSEALVADVTLGA